MRILIVGYYGFGNLGDELILSTLISQLRSKFKAAALTVLSQSPEETSRAHGVRAVSRWNPARVLPQLWRSDLFVLGGGGLLQNATSSRSLFYYLALVGLARLLRCPVLLYAVGVESISRPFWRTAVAWTLSATNVRITVRDAESRGALVRLGIPEKSVHVTGDPVFCRGAWQAPIERYKKPAALLIPRFPCPASGWPLYESIVRLLRDTYELDVKGLLFQPPVETRFAEKMAPLEWLRTGSVEEIMETFGRFDYVVSARFHGLVLAAMAGRPFLGVGSEEKVGRLCRSWNMPFINWEAQENEVKETLATLRSSDRPHFQNVEDSRRAAARIMDYLG